VESVEDEADHREKQVRLATSTAVSPNYHHLHRLIEPAAEIDLHAVCVHNRDPPLSNAPSNPRLHNHVLAAKAVDDAVVSLAGLQVTEKRRSGGWALLPNFGLVED